MRWFWQKSDESNKKLSRPVDLGPAPMVRLPEESPVPMRARVLVAGFGEEGYLESFGLREAGRPWSFVEYRRNAIQQIVTSLNEVYPVPADEWEDRVCHSENQDRELGRWMHIARVYARVTAPDAGPHTPQKKHDIFRILVACSNSTARDVLRLSRGSLSRNEMNGLVAAYYE